jgi:hypothetical protein
MLLQSSKHVESKFAPYLTLEKDVHSLLHIALRA